jgi:phosphate starvation-inducible PhoH-like protein
VALLSDQTILQTEILLGDASDATSLLGPLNRNLNSIQDIFDVRIRTRGDRLLIEGEQIEVNHVVTLFGKLKSLLKQNHIPEISDVTYLAEQIRSDQDVGAVLKDVIQHTHWGEEIRAKTHGQARYIKSVQKHEVVFGIGPSGTGKTYLAVAMAVNSLKRGDVHRIILTRPAVEAGEELGFLPGDIEAKVNPYLRPLYDALFEMIPPAEVALYLENRRIEIAPLAFMRGRTLNNSFVILDEAQNTTPGQMKMFLTRLGLDSRAVITGDVTQIDLQRGKSGLVEVQKILEGIDEINFVYLEKSDVVRHQLVKRILDAYEKVEEAQGRS